MSTSLTPVTLLAVATLFSALTGCSQAVSETPNAPATSMVGAMSQYDGMVVRPAKSFVIMSDDGIERSFNVVEETKIRVDGQISTLDSVKAGDKAAVTADKHEGQIVATLIEVESAETTSR